MGLPSSCSLERDIINTPSGSNDYYHEQISFSFYIMHISFWTLNLSEQKNPHESSKARIAEGLFESSKARIAEGLFESSKARIAEGLFESPKACLNRRRLFESQKRTLQSPKACLNFESTKCVPQGHRT